jgi:hypothetical protein
MCYCIKGFRQCVVKKCAPLLRGCIPKLPREGNCCPTSYDCKRRSLKITRQIQQPEEPEEDTDSIDFFSLLFGSDEPPEEEKIVVSESTTLPPFKALPTTEKSFFDFIRAGLEIIDANADKIDSSINGILTTPKNISENENNEIEKIKITIPKSEMTQSSTIEMITEKPTTLSTTTQRVTISTKKAVSTIKPSSLSTDKASTSKAPTTKTTKSSGITAAKSTSKAGMKNG